MTARYLVVTVLAVVVGCRGPSEADRILQQLRSPDKQTVMWGITAARMLRDREAKAGRLVPTGDNAIVVRELRRMLTAMVGPTVKSRIALSFALSPIPGPQPELIECARTELESVAFDCFSALSKSPDPVNIAALVEMIADPSLRTEWDSDLQEHRAIRGDRTRGAITALRGLGDAAVPSLAPLIKDGTAVARELALMSLAYESNTGAKAALPALTDSNHWIRYLAADVIKRDPAQVEALRPLLDDPAYGVRREAQEGLGLPIEPVPSETSLDAAPK